MMTFKSGEIPRFDFKEAIKKPIAIRCIQIQELFKVETMEGTLEGRPGDYLMIGIKGEMYPCAKEIFEESYEIVQ